jgi:hypothetical protein
VHPIVGSMLWEARMAVGSWSVRGSVVSLLALGILMSCSVQDGSGTGDEPRTGDELGTSRSESVNAKLRIGELRARFAVLGAAVATGFEHSESGGLRALLPAGEKQRVLRPAAVELPARADGETRLDDAVSHVKVHFRLQDAKPSVAAVADGYALYAGALDGADVIHRVHAEGTEDYVVFETRPAREELRYEVDVSRVAGLRLVTNTLEFLDHRGSPALRIAPPYVVDAKGDRHDAKLAVTGCVVDANGGAPWGQPVVSPGGDRCTVHVTWNGVTYPAMVDPAWSATGSMTVPRFDATVSLLPSGKVLIAGGGFNNHIWSHATAELFDPDAASGAGAFVATGSMSIARVYHTASVLPSGKVLVVGGTWDAVANATADLFDPGADGGAGAFIATGPMAAKRLDHTATVLASGKVLVTGGYYEQTGILSSAEIFDPTANGGTGAFAATGSMATARRVHTATRLASGKVLIAGGTGLVGGVGPATATLASVEMFDPAANGGTGSFTAAGPMLTPRTRHTASVLPSGKVLLASFATAELFDPAAAGGAGSFVATGPKAAGGSTGCLLTSGKVLFPSGSGSALYDPVSNGGGGTFTSVAPLTTNRGLFSATTLSSGKVLVVGGIGTVGTTNIYFNSAELFGGVLGDVCASNSYCFSGFCADGRCCDTACTAGSCDRCDLPGTEGTCTIAPVGNPGTTPACLPFACDGASASCPTSCTSDASCDGSRFCAANGTCQMRKPLGAGCNVAIDCKGGSCRECQSNACVDGVCCSGGCTGQCEACDVEGSKGTCTPVTGSPHGSRNGCFAGVDSKPCSAAQCDGITPSYCAGLVGPQVVCGAASCTNRASTGAGHCDAKGGCEPPQSISCGAYACGPADCNATCARDSDCASDHRCDVSSQKCVGQATCDGAHTTTSSDGTKHDCLAYRCESNGTCKESCGSTDDCVAPAVCSVEGRCVAPVLPVSGCSVMRAPAGADASAAGASAIALVLALARRRKRQLAGRRAGV